ncbi:hypothetical protein BRPE64_BCDS13440 [Caballeronia insecticola]|uniref:Uncharacterized protein n=1 Tax=Caballeronia insecticola TaxID=758793 RepID=R4WXM0_9BURK|nr:hypothetical protein BRPE64_BCDS13440 [Caballeronia insecticola]
MGTDAHGFLSFLIWQSNGTRPVPCRQDGLALKRPIIRTMTAAATRAARHRQRTCANLESQFDRVLVFSRAADADFGTGPIGRERTPGAALRESVQRVARRFPTRRPRRTDRTYRID